MMMMMMMMKSSPSGLFLFLLLLSSSMSVLGSVVWKDYKYISAQYNWSAAQSYCRRAFYNSDLLTIYKQSDTNHIQMKRYYSWIGLHREASSSFLLNAWSWSNGQPNVLNTWASGEPNLGENCASVHYGSRRFYGTGCETFLFFICQKSNISTLPHLQYTFVPQSKTWPEAQQYCREKFTDLADLNSYLILNSAVSKQDFPIWTGLHKDGETWKWSRGSSDYRRWASAEEGKYGKCVSISSLSHKMASQNCSAQFPFICLRDNLVLVKESKTWEEALEHCRALTSSSNPPVSHELVSVEPGEEHDYVINRVKEADTEKVWAGLRFLAGHWLWVNKANVLYSDLPVCPPAGQHCGALSKNDEGSVETADCSEKLNFLCYRTQ